MHHEFKRYSEHKTVLKPKNVDTVTVNGHLSHATKGQWGAGQYINPSVHAPTHQGPRPREWRGVTTANHRRRRAAAAASSPTITIDSATIADRRRRTDGPTDGPTDRRTDRPAD